MFQGLLNVIFIVYILKGGTIVDKYQTWSIHDNTIIGSSMWRKILKHRDKAKDMHMLRVGDGQNVLFWFDS